MPIRDPDARRRYQREWMRRRRDEWIAANGPCAACGSNDRLEVDHIDPSRKQIEPRGIWSLTAVKREAELTKCQVLCHDCHKAKTIAQVSTALHGTHSKASRGCKCPPCREGNAAYERARRARRKAAA